LQTGCGVFLKQVLDVLRKRHFSLTKLAFTPFTPEVRLADSYQCGVLNERF
jgi:hypothetical protein